MKQKIKAVILDWAGTVVDHGSRAPMGAFVGAFAHFGVEITIADARGPMGMAKRDHIRAVGTTPAIAAAWRARQGTDFDDAAIDAIFGIFEPMNVAAVEAHATLIPGALAAIQWCAARGIRIGSTTGYTRPIMERLMPLAAAQGFVPEVTICAGDLVAGRPAPLQIWSALSQMGIWPASSVLKLDDTAPGIGEARAAGCWAVGATLTGNNPGLSAEELARLAPDQREELRRASSDALLRAGAHLVIDSITELPWLVEHIEARLEAGEKPGIFEAN